MSLRPALLVALLTTGSFTRAQAPTPEPTPPPQPVVPLELRSGKVDLPLSGLLVDLPAQQKGHLYKISSSYSLDSGFDARDVIDEAVDGKLVGGTWVLVGFFTAGTCRDVVGKTELAEAWESELELHDIAFVTRGGIFDFQDTLGKVPAAVMCAERPKLEAGTRKALLLYHYFLGADLATPRDELLALLKKRPAIERTAKAWKLDTLAKGRSLDNPHVRVRGSRQRSTLELAVSKLTVRVPDDGTLWTTRAAPDEGVDWLDRMVPALPEVSVEVIHAAESCAKILPMITGKRMKGAPAARHVPSDWKPGPILDIDGDPEYTLCRDFKDGAILLGYFLDKSFAKDLGDLRPIHALLDALTAAKL